MKNYRPEMSIQSENNNLNYLIDLTFTNVNRLFAISFENGDDRTYFFKYYTPSVLTLLQKNKGEIYEKVIEMGKKNNHLGFEYFSKHYELIAIDFSKHIKLENPDLEQQIHFIGKLDVDNATMSFIIKK